MKTAISLPDPLFSAGEQFAQERGLSRSELYARALQFYLDAQEAQAITDALNKVYGDQPSELDPFLLAAQQHLFRKEEW